MSKGGRGHARENVVPLELSQKLHLLSASLFVSTAGFVQFVFVKSQ